MTIDSISIISPYKEQDQPRLATAEDSALNYYTEELVAALSRYCRVSVFASQYNDSMRWRDGNACIIPTFTRGAFNATLKIARAGIKARSRCIHVQHELFAYGGLFSAVTLPLALAAMRLVGKRVVTTIHGILPLETIDMDFVRKNGLHVPPAIARTVWRMLIRAICLNSDIIHVHEELYQHRLLKDYGINTRISVIPLGVAAKPPIDKEEKIEWKKHFNIPAEDEVLLFFGYFAGYKGLEQLIDAIPPLLSDRPKLTILLAGEVPKRLTSANELRGRIDALIKEGQKIVSVGFVPEKDVRAVFAVADVLILPYTSAIAASGPLAISAAHSIPVMVSSQLQAIMPNVPLFFNTNPDDIRRAVNQFFDDPVIRKLSNRYITEFMNKRSWTRVADEFLALYRSI